MFCRVGREPGVKGKLHRCLYIQVILRPSYLSMEKVRVNRQKITRLCKTDTD